MDDSSDLEARALRVEQARIPRRFRDSTFSGFHAEVDSIRQVRDSTMEYAAEFDDRRKKGESLLLMGPPGTGKTHLGCAVALSVIANGHKAGYMTAMGLIRAVRDTWRKDSPISESEMLRRLTNLDLLVIDEIGVQYATDGERNVLFDVINSRYNEMQPMVLLSNLDATGLKEVLGDRSYDRLREIARVFVLSGPSNRGAAAR